ncbi:isochorismatase family protein [Kribbella sandramycini]|uniref:Isochorismatase family protein n=1 Tax=Kribbella sandramycini TaxID=60450 RepID=A0A7Y4KWL9_9ACTN|nr:isochorismatase family protein [Kribbella sandramycini]MBB6568034.1 nicotinamidase-related amidase [Kribbella sandramycini]NOL39372.1 isochorismatase family protein [Kribbella sandramycini]
MADHPPLDPVDALIVVDVQTAFVSGPDAVPGAAVLLDRITELLAKARSAGAVVVHLQNDGPPGADDEPGTPGWKLYLPTKPGPREHILRKPHDDGFDSTDLGPILVAAAVRSVAICGLMSEMCVQATARTALDRGYHVVLPYDAHATYNIPAIPNATPAIPAHLVSRVAAYSLGDTPNTTTPTTSITFTGS